LLRGSAFLFAVPHLSSWQLEIKQANDISVGSEQNDLAAFQKRPAPF
jgi:hypothetical protein